MEKENTALKERLAGMVHKMKAMGQEYRSQLEQTSERQASLEAIIKRQLSEFTHLHKMIEEKDKQMAQLDRLAYPLRYRLSSEAELDHLLYRTITIHPCISGRKSGMSFLRIRNMTSHTTSPKSIFVEN